MITSVVWPAARIRRSTSRPLVSGRWTSSSTRSTPPRASTRRASAPVRRLGHHLEAAHPPDVLGVRRRRHRVVLDDQRADHTRSRTGSVHHEHRARVAALDAAPCRPPGAPPGPTSASPSPRGRPSRASLVLQPRVNARSAVAGSRPGPLSATLSTACSPVDPPTERHPARRGRGLGGVDRVVDEVADDRDEVAGVGEPVGDVAVGLQPQVDALLARLGHLRDDERGQLRHPDRGQHGVGELLRDGELGGRELQRLVGAAQLDQRDHGVQLVGGLVGLGVERVGEPAHRGQLADQRPQLGVVAQGDDRAEPTPVPPRLLLVDHDDALGGEVDLVGPHLAGRERLAERRRAAPARRSARRAARRAGRAAAAPRR